MPQGIDTVEISRIEKLIEDLDREGLLRFFTEAELKDAGEGANRAEKLAARFAAKEACCKLFPKEICLGTIEPVDFSVMKNPYGQPGIQPSERARAVMNLYRVHEIELSMTHTTSSATAIASA
ncbi:MAG: holo-ACP synthase, partial [Verrucomicrobiota bacterium]